MTTRAGHPDRRRDFIIGAADARRNVVWYDTYADSMPQDVRGVIRRAIDRATRSTGAQIAMRVLPHDDDIAQERARSAIAAGWQNAFRSMHDRVTAADAPKARDGMIDAARDLGLDADLFRSDLDSERTRERLAEDRVLARGDGRSEGPLLYIDGQLYRGALDEDALVDALEKPLGVRLHAAGMAFFEWAAAGGLVIVLATLLALAVVNFGLHAPYETLRESVLSLGWNNARFGLTVEQWVNDGLMTLFFLIVGIEIKREIVAGELSDPRRAALPIVAALGGMVVPALIFLAINWGTETVHGWGVPMATDIAFTLGLLAILGSRVPASLRVFLSALAIADDLGAIIVIAIFYSSGIAAGPLLVAFAIFMAMAILNRVRVYALWPYLLLGVFLWVAIFAGGLHATLAGVLTALAIPSRRPAAVHGVAAQTSAIMRREAEQAEAGETFAVQTVERLNEVMHRLREPGMHLQKGLENWTNFLILPLFAFFNTGLILTGGAFDLTAAPSLGVMAGLVLGKPIGICVACWMILQSGLASKSNDITWRHLIGAGCLAGIGFTMSIFIAAAAFEGPALASVKITVLLASVTSAVIGMAILWKSPAGPETP